jgi:hypothetical protein
MARDDLRLLAQEDRKYFKCLNKNGLKTRILHRASLRGPRSNTRRTARGRFMRERQQQQQQQQQQQREALS